MRERVCCIYSSDKTFAVKLADYINTRHLLPLQVVVYTNEDAVRKSTESYNVELLIVDGQDKPEWINELSDTVVYLNNGYNDEKDSIARYQPADRLVKKIMAHMTGFENRMVGNKRAKLGCIYSPASKCFKTSLALGLGLWSAKKGKSLFINLEQFAGLGNILSSQAGGLSQALYYFKTLGREGLGKIISCADIFMEMEYFYPVTCGEDIGELDSREFIEFINLLVECERYDYIWIDVGNTYGNPWRLMEVSDAVYIPGPLDNIDRRKVSQMENYLVSSGRGELLSRFNKVDIHFNEDMAGYDISGEVLLNSWWGSRINEIIKR